MWNTHSLLLFVNDFMWISIKLKFGLSFLIIGYQYIKLISSYINFLE